MTVQRLSLDEWRNIFDNIMDAELWEIDDYGDWVEVIWLETTGEWVLCYGGELFENGFSSEDEANERLQYLEDEILPD